MLAYTAVIAVIALALAIPFAIGASLFITEYAPRELRRPLTSLVDLLAAVPSLIYGLWGRFFLQPQLHRREPVAHVHSRLRPDLQGRQEQRGFAASTFIAGVVVALMIVPICTAVMREVFSQAPPGEKEGALALGGHEVGNDPHRRAALRTRRHHRRLDARPRPGARRDHRRRADHLADVRPDASTSCRRGGNSIAATDRAALQRVERRSGISALMAAGLALFVMTLLVNSLASVVVSRSRSGAATEI